MNIGTVLNCPRCGHEFRRKYIVVSKFNDAVDERDAARRAFNRLEATISHHKRVTDQLFADTHDEALYAARDRIVLDAAKALR